MTLNELLAIVGRPASSRAAFDRDVSLARLRTVHPNALGPTIPLATDDVPSSSGAHESGDMMVYVAVPLSMLTSAPITPATALNRNALPRWRYHFGGWSLAVLEQSLLAPGGGILHLRNAEFALLLAFLEQPWQVLQRRTLAMRLRRANRPLPSDRAVDSYVCRLRAHFRDAGSRELIASVHAVGYRFDSDVSRI